MKPTEYSFIIPHKNSPSLLQRCVDSIPLRDDVQIIVVDDNSDEDKKPDIVRNGVEIILLNAEQSKGAGRARNDGLKRAKGKWLLFADCDDYYLDGFLDILDKYLNDDIEVLYFNASIRNFRGKEVESGLNKVIQRYDGDKDSTDFLKYRIHSPWCKMVSKAFVDKHHISFEECPNGNDIWYTYQVGYFSRKIKVIPDKLYVYTMNRHSITHKRRSEKAVISYLSNMKKQRQFFRFLGHEEWCNDINLKNYIRNLLRSLNITEVVNVLINYIKHKDVIAASENKYVELIKAHYTN